MTIAREDIEALRLLKAFEKVKDQAKRREIIDLVEASASAAKRRRHPQADGVDRYIGLMDLFAWLYAFNQSRPHRQRTMVVSGSV